VQDVWWLTASSGQWTRATAAAAWTPRYRFAAVAHSGQIWIMGGITAPAGSAAGRGRVTNDVWQTASLTGAAWNAAVAAGSAGNRSGAMWSPRQGLVGLSFSGSLWVIGGISSGKAAPAHPRPCVPRVKSRCGEYCHPPQRDSVDAPPSSPPGPTPNPPPRGRRHRRRSNCLLPKAGPVGPARPGPARRENQATAARRTRRLRAAESAGRRGR
jgi:hypothetical protein